MIVTVALDSDVEAARPWIEATELTYCSLIDQDHVVSGLYNMVNVPQTVWIDENGMMVRPPETGGSIDMLRFFDPETGTFAEDKIALAGEAKQTYMDAIRDWAINGADSKYVFDAKAAKDHVPQMSGDVALAHATFQLGRHMQEQGDQAEADRLYALCRDLHPASWNIFRQTTEKEETGIAVGPEFFAKVQGLGDEPYYAGVDMEGMPQPEDL